MVFWQQTDIWWENSGYTTRTDTGENRGMNSFEHLWMKRWSSTREKAGELTIHHVNKLRIQTSKRPEEWYNQLTILGGDIWKLLKTYRILQVKKDILGGGWIQVFPPIPTFARDDWRCFTEAYSDSDLSAGCLPKQLECCFSNVFLLCFVPKV